MSRYSSALGSHSDFHVTYQDFVDDLYLTYLFDPVGYSVIDVCFFIPFVYQELTSPRGSLLRHMIELGQVKAHFRRFPEIDSAALRKKTSRRDPRTKGPFRQMLSSLRGLNVGGHLDSSEADKTAQILDSLDFESDFPQWWPANPDGSVIETGCRLEELVSRVTAPEFVNTALVVLGDRPDLKANVAEIEQVQEFLDKGIELQRQYHGPGVGLRITSFLKAVAASHGVTDIGQISSPSSLLTALQESGHSHAIEITKKGLRVLADRHCKNLSDFLKVGYSNAKSDILTDMLALTDSSEDRTNLDRISVPVSIPGLRKFQRVPIPELTELLVECGFTEYQAAFTAWNEVPSVENVQGVVRALKLFEQSLMERHPGENYQQFEASFWHGLSKTVRDKWIICHIEAQGEPLRTASLMTAEMASLYPTATKVLVDIMTGNKPSLIKTGLEKLGKGREESQIQRYEQFALSRSVDKYYPVTLTRYKNFTRN
jgi:hypothetical protein